MRMEQRIGGKITGVAVSGGDLDAASASALHARKKTVSKAASNRSGVGTPQRELCPC
jgi:phycocyanin-associated, rod